MQTINFYNQDITFVLKHKTTIRQWIKKVVEQNTFEIQEINFIFCPDDYLLQINVEHLNHNYYTDIITFDNSEKQNSLTSDLFISIDRVKDNAKQFNVIFAQELNRVMIHGILHLMGLKDKTKEEKKMMRQQENNCLEQLKIMLV